MPSDKLRRTPVHQPQRFRTNPPKNPCGSKQEHTIFSRELQAQKVIQQALFTMDFLGTSSFPPSDVVLVILYEAQ